METSNKKKEECTYCQKPINTSIQPWDYIFPDQMFHLGCKISFHSLLSEEGGWEERFDKEFWYINNETAHEKHADGCKCRMNHAKNLKSFIEKERTICYNKGYEDGKAKKESQL